MLYQEKIRTYAADAAQLEELYQAAVRAGEVDAFRQAIDDGQTSAPDNLLYAAWYYRLKNSAIHARDSFIAWAWVIPLALLNGLLLWWLSDDQRFTVEIAGIGGSAATGYLPTAVLAFAPISAAIVMAYLTVAGRKRWGLFALIALVLLAAGAYVLWVYPRAGTRPFQEQYLTLMAMHLPLLAWAGVGALLVFEHRDPANRFAFLLKSLEVFVMGGLFVIAGGLFTAITFGLFQALDVELPTLVQRLFIAGGAGLIPVIATAVIYNPTAPPAGQAFDEGLSRMVAMLTRILLPLTVLVLLVYLFFIPFNFFEPFNNRDVLIIYNGMLFAVIALMVGVTPASLGNISPRLAQWLRRGIIAVAILASIVSIYALAAILYRTALDRLTPNRLTFIGWNVINLGLLIFILYTQARAKAGQWLQGLFRAYSLGTVAYTVWTLAVILLIPWLFGINQGQLENLPPVVQRIVYDTPDPILLKCNGSPHIYLLDRGEKRWIDTIATFTDRGYVWREVHFIPCNDLRGIPDGVPIPADAGPPPQP